MACDLKDFPKKFLNYIGKNLYQNVDLRQYSNFQIGGRADFLFEASSIKQLVEAVLLAKKHSCPFYVIGGGYNIIFDDDGFRGLIIKNCAKGIKHTSEKSVEVDSGVTLKEFLKFCLERELGGMEFLAGIPGTIGGAVYGNAGAFGKDIGSFLEKATLLDDKGESITVSQSYFAFGYRYSILKRTQQAVLKASFSLVKEDQEKIKEKIENNLEARRKKHPPLSLPCCGSYFKNPVLPSGKKVAAAVLLEQVGAKNLRVGGAAVYKGHANFIYNIGGATAKDVLQLASKLKERVKERFGVVLEEEVIFLPAISQ